MHEHQISAETFKTLNDLIEISIDGQKGFTEAAELVDDADLRHVFITYAASCGKAVLELSDCARALGERQPERTGTISGATSRGWQRIKAALLDSNLATLEEMEKSEDRAKELYQRALKEETLPLDVRAVIQRQYHGVLEHHDRIRDLREQYLKAN